MCPIPNVGITDHIWRNKTVKGSVLYFFRRTNKTPPEHVHFNCLYRNLLWKTPKVEYRQFSCYIPKMLFIKEERVYPFLYLEMFLLKQSLSSLLPITVCYRNVPFLLESALSFTCYILEMFLIKVEPPFLLNRYILEIFITKVESPLLLYLFYSERVHC